MPSSLTVNHSSALGYSPRPPVSVYGTGSLDNLRRVSRRRLEASMGSPEGSPYCRRSGLMWGGFAYPTPYAASTHHSVGARTLHHRVTPQVSVFGRYGNVDPFAITYAFRPRLRTRLTLFRLTLNRNPWAYGGSVTLATCRYSCLHFLFQKLHQASRLGFSAAGMLPYHSRT